MISLRLIQTIVHEYPVIFRPTRIEPLGAAGGMSGAQFWRIESASGTLALRQWPAEHPSADRLRFIHNVLFHATRHGVSFLAVPIRTLAGESFVSNDGHLWELSPWMPGTADYFHSPSERKLCSAMKALAAFHKAVADFPTTLTQHTGDAAPAITKRLTQLNELSNGGGIQRSQAVTGNLWPELEPLARKFLALLPKLLPRAIAPLEPLANIRQPLQPCIRDIWHDHVLFRGDEVSGIIDFGAMDIDTPATDVARLLGSLVGDDNGLWRTGLNAYTTIRPLILDEERAAKALDLSSTILAGCSWIRWIYVERRQFEDHAQIVERFQRIVARCEFAAANSSTAPGSAGG